MVLFSLLDVKIFCKLWKQWTDIHSLGAPLLVNSQDFLFFFFPCIQRRPLPQFVPHTASPQQIMLQKCWNSIYDTTVFFSKISEATEITSPSNKAYSSGTTFKRKVESQKVQSESSVSEALKRFSVERILHLRAPEKMNTNSGPGAHCLSFFLFP